MKPDAEQKKTGSGRKAYETPKLVRYGSVEKLTQSGGSTQPDAHQAKQHHPAH
ncbi:MAG TPA: lasso RiPP family leader peptide-containing protein [Candidatus Acidoferrales bacterium]|nr:lasso RiPP family leader peptide-containing protein [Candidatus Acidoferrales bacterium]